VATGEVPELAPRPGLRRVDPPPGEFPRDESLVGRVAAFVDPTTGGPTIIRPGPAEPRLLVPGDPGAGLEPSRRGHPARAGSRCLDELRYDLAERLQADVERHRWGPGPPGRPGPARLLAPDRPAFSPDQLHDAEFERLRLHLIGPGGRMHQSWPGPAAPPAQAPGPPQAPGGEESSVRTRPAGSAGAAEVLAELRAIRSLLEAAARGPDRLPGALSAPMPLYQGRMGG